MSFTDIASYCHRASPLWKFGTNLAHTSLINIAGPITHALEDVLDFRPQLEVIKTPGGQLLFREDWQYVAVKDEAVLPFNPFACEELPPGDIFRAGKEYPLYSETHLAHVWPERIYDFMMNPALCELVADFLIWSMNIDQLWVRRHRAPGQHFLQKYLRLDRLVEANLPELQADLKLMYEDVGGEQTRYRLARNGLSREAGMAGYEARAIAGEQRTIQEFWDKQPVQGILNEYAMQLERIISAHFPASRGMTELSLHPAHGYDVYYAVANDGAGVNILRLGDYRILDWEMNQ